MKVIERMTVEHEGNCEITFIRIDPEDLQQTLATILEVLMDLSWLSKFDEDYIKASYAQRANETITDIKNKFATSIDDKITKEAGEYVVSELARESLQSQLNYLHVPLAELLGMKISGNPGFDFHSQNGTTNTVIFGEAKYNSHSSAYSAAISQVSQFVIDKKDIKQIVDLQSFCSSEALKRANEGFKGFAIAFSAKTTSSDDLIKNILAHAKFAELLSHVEIILLAVNL